VLASFGTFVSDTIRTIQVGDSVILDGIGNESRNLTFVNGGTGVTIVNSANYYVAYSIRTTIATGANIILKIDSFTVTNSSIPALSDIGQMSGSMVLHFAAGSVVSIGVLGLAGHSVTLASGTNVYLSLIQLD
jgi:hypothetical protein